MLARICCLFHFLIVNMEGTGDDFSGIIVLESFECCCSWNEPGLKVKNFHFCIKSHWNDYSSLRGSSVNSTISISGVRVEVEEKPGECSCIDRNSLPKSYSHLISGNQQGFPGPRESSCSSLEPSLKV